MDIRLVNLTKIFADKDQKNEVRAVDSLDVTIPSGKLVGLLGPSGCGKSTTLYMISGLLEPTLGQIHFGDEDVTEVPAEKRGIGLVFQSYALYPHMTVLKNILFPLENLKLEKEEAMERVYKYAKLVGIDSLLDRKPKQLSGGQQQRVAIARALVKEPKVLLLDEPLSNLDARLRLQTREEIKRIQKETGITTVFVTHDQEEAMSISDQIVVMKDGVEQQIGIPQEVYNNPKNLFVAKFLGTPPITVYAGTVSNGGLYIGNEKIENVELDNGEVFVGVRPEGYELSQNGALTIELEHVEYIGRDISVVGKNPNCLSEGSTFRFIIDADTNIENFVTEVDGKKYIKVDVKSHKCFVFNKLTEERIK